MRTPPESLTGLTSCLNPCFNGTYSMSGSEKSSEAVELSLNPCFNGTYSMSSPQ